MPGPNSWLFLIALAAGSGGLLVWLVRAARMPLKVLAGVLAFAVSTLFGAGLVNNFYQYYTSWSALYDDLTNAGAVAYTPTAADHPDAHLRLGAVGASQSPPSSIPPSPVASASAAGPLMMSIPRLDLSSAPDRGAGRLVRLQLPGSASGITRTGYVYLPAQYFEPAYADVRFPVLELLHGDPGEPNNWVYGLQLPSVMDRASQSGRIGPMVVVMPGTFSGAHGNDCVDGGGMRNDTYLSRDVPADIAAEFRVLPPGPNWGIGGLSDGGFCAANLALRHRGAYGAVASMDGFYTAQADRAVMNRVFGADGQALADNDPTSHVADLTPLPRFWIMAGTGNRFDFSAARDFENVVQAREPVQCVTVRGGDHTPPAWRAVLPDLLVWAWTTLSGQTSPTGVEELHVTGPAPSPSPPVPVSRPTPTPTSPVTTPTRPVATPTSQTASPTLTH